MIETSSYFGGLGDPTLLIPVLALLAGGAFVLALWIALGPQRRDRPPRHTPSRRTRVAQDRARRVEAALRPDATPSGLHDPAAQLTAIARAEFERTPLLNREEARFLPMIERVLRDIAPDHRVMCQTSLREVIRPAMPIGTAHDQAHAAINAKRLDFAIINRFGLIVAALEHQGTGHPQTAAFLRDAVKREVLRKSGVAFLDLAPRMSEADLRQALMGIIGETPLRLTDPLDLGEAADAAPEARQARSG